MRVRETVFDSRSERRAFNAIRGRWSHAADLFPQLPLAKIIELDAAELERWPASELRYFRATNIDYTLCDSTSGAPWLSIEFDGIGGGFSRGGSYVPRRPTNDRRRQWKLDFKLRVTRQVWHPLIVVSFEEVETLTEVDELTILDGFIGGFLAGRAFPDVVARLVDESRAELDALEGFAHSEYAQDLVFAAEIEANVEHDPLAKEAMEETSRAFAAGVEGFGVEYLMDPPLRESPAFPPPPEVIAANRNAYDGASRMGCRVKIRTPLGTVERVAWVRNVGPEWGLSATSIAENIATLLAMRSARGIASGELPPP